MSITPVPKKDPYGRPSLRRVLIGAASLIGVLVASVAIRGIATDRMTSVRLAAVAGVAVAIAAWIFVFIGIWWSRPNPQAARKEHFKVATTNLPRLTAATTIIFSPAYIAMGDNVLIGSSSIVSLLVIAAVHAMVLSVTRFRVRFDAVAVERVVVFGWTRKITWDAVTRIYAQPTGVYLFDRNGHSVAVWNRFLDGYPEFVRELLRRVPTRVVDEAGDMRAILERQAALASQE